MDRFTSRKYCEPDTNNSRKICGECGVIEPYIANTGQAVEVGVSNLTKVGKLLSSEEMSAARAGSEAGLLRYASMFLPGVRAASVFHDVFANRMMSVMGDGTLFTALNVALIPPAFAMQYQALGINNFRKYVDQAK